MVNQEYFAAGTPASEEDERLTLLEQLLDPLTIQRFERLGVSPGWRCLLVAAGRGSITRWLANRVGPTGTVVAADRDIRFLQRLSMPGLQVREQDVLRDPIDEEEAFDIVHCRCFLMHVSQPEVALRNMVATLRPGGWLLVEEPDDSASGPAGPAYPNAESIAATNRRMLDALKARGVMDPYIGRRLPRLLESAGLSDIQCEGVAWGHRGNDVAAQFTLATLPLHQASGQLTAAEAEELRLAFSDPTFHFVDSINFGAWGRRPI